MHGSRWTLSKLLLAAGGAAMVLAACTGATATPAPLPTAVVSSATRTPATPSTAAATEVVEAAASATPGPYAEWTIANLRARQYGGGEITVERISQPAFGFERHFISYPSDGLQIHGFMNVPVGKGPFPTALVLHGYISPAEYETLAYTRVYADALARAGYLVLHPNYRNYPPSDVGPNDFRAGYALDILNLVAIVRATAGQAGALERAQPGWQGLFGHSMGGGIALRAITIDPEIDAAVLYGSMSGDERRNHEKIVEWSGGRAGWEELNAPAEVIERVSPSYHLTGIEAAVSIHHGLDDQIVPPQWSSDLCTQLQQLGKTVECFEYPSMPHTFFGDGEELLLERTLQFFASTRR